MGFDSTTEHDFRGRSRRRFLTTGAASLALALTSTPLRRSVAAAAATDESASPARAARSLIVNADDLGLCEVVDEGIFDAHVHGIVSSASLLVRAPHAADAVRAAFRHPNLGLGLHATFPKGQGWAFEQRNLPAVRHDLEQQVATFIKLVGAPPDHLDSHHHIHRAFNVGRVFLEVGARYGIPVRGLSEVTFVGSFYGQWVYGKTELTYIEVDYLVGLLQRLDPGISELSCHPARPGSILDEVYGPERAVELKTLTEAKVKDTLREEGIQLINFRDYLKHTPATVLAAPCRGISATVEPR